MPYAWWYYTIGINWLAQQLVFILDTWLWHLVHDGDISWVIWHLFIVWHVDRGIWLMHFMDDIFCHIAWCWCTWLIYIGVVHDENTFLYMDVLHRGHILVHDWYLDYDSLFYCWHIFCFMMLGMGWIWCMNRSKDHYMVAYCWSCREYRRRHTHRGSHSSSHDSRRRYLSDAYLEKSPIFEERA